MRTIAPLQMMNLVKSFGILFFLSSFAWFTTSYVLFGDIRISWLIFIANVAVGMGMGWWWYRRHYHTVFGYDDQSFELQRGGGQRNHRDWRDFSQVSLVHEGYGKFSVRIYEADGKYTDMPASDLKLPASDFRFEVMDLVKPRSTAGALGSQEKGAKDGPGG
ncbi:MAG TPA: hypothetical protein VM075_07100 [Anaerolineae bacterium]|nr:hypothetical protein [Anaerolineae bacterium]